MSARLHQALLLAGGGGGSIPWFDIVTWTGTGSGDATVSTSLDLSDGALVWVKRRNANSDHVLYFKDASGSTVRSFSTNNTTAVATPTATLANGSFTVPDNVSGATYVAWVFKKQAGCFNIVPYTGNGSAGRTVAHGLGSVPKMAFCCPLTGTKLNYLQHTSLGGTQSLRIDSNAVVNVSNQQWNNTAMDGTNVTLGTSTLVNANAVGFVLFVFGGTDFAAGSFAGSASPVDVTVGFAPRMLALKRVSSTSGGWGMFDTTRTPGFTGNDALLLANSNSSESAAVSFLSSITNGATVASGNYNTAGGDTVWFAIK